LVVKIRASPIFIGDETMLGYFLAPTRKMRWKAIGHQDASRLLGVWQIESYCKAIHTIAFLKVFLKSQKRIQLPLLGISCPIK
jgi:hypothetical protein